jgi:NAD/NADP transhydrogenase beta subunit
MTETTNEDKLRGIGGWLLLLALGQILGPIKFVVSIVQYYATLETALFEKLPVTLAGEALLNLAAGALYFITAVLFFRTSKRFPRFFVYEIIATVAVLPVSVGWVALGIGFETGQPGWSAAVSTVTPREVLQTIGGAIFGAIWVVYLKKSRRAANTFVH